MKERNFDEMIAYFNRRVSEMDIAQDYKMELLGMVTALGYKHEKTAQQWIPRSERMPEKPGEYFCCWQGKAVSTGMFLNGHFRLFGENKDNLVTAWMPLPEPYRAERRE